MGGVWGASRSGRPSSAGAIEVASPTATCSAPASDTEFPVCAARKCQGAIRAALGEATHAVLGAATRVTPVDVGYVRLVGVIDDEVRASAGAPRGYECELSGLEVVRARLIR